MRWQDAYVATSLVLGESDEGIASALGGKLPLNLPSAKDGRARVVASTLAGVLRELEAIEAGPWGS